MQSSGRNIGSEQATSKLITAKPLPYKRALHPLSPVRLAFQRREGSLGFPAVAGEAQPGFPFPLFGIQVMDDEEEVREEAAGEVQILAWAYEYPFAVKRGKDQAAARFVISNARLLEVAVLPDADKMDDRGQEKIKGQDEEEDSCDKKYKEGRLYRKIDHHQDARSPEKEAQDERKHAEEHQPS